jgi:hypothetical protein
MNLKTLAAVSCLGLMTLVPSAMADQWNKKTYLTVNEPIQVPGQVLQPGKYVMKLMDSPANRHIVQIFNEREDHLYTTVLAIPNYRLQPTGKTEFGWWETPAGQPKAMRAWFYPGDNFGQEFAYPKNEAVTIAAATNENVPTTYAQTEAELATARVGTVDRAGTEMELDRETYTRQAGNQPSEPTTTAEVQREEPVQAPVAQEPTVQREEPTEVAQNQPVEQPSYDYDRVERSRTLPRTASPLPLIGLAGLASLGASVLVRRLGNRS